MLTQVTRVDAASAFFGEEYVPRRAITMGVGTILEAKKVGGKQACCSSVPDLLPAHPLFHALVLIVPSCMLACPAA
jgi:hypothetical protein